MATHIESLEISAYRGIKNLEIDGLSDVNIFVGDNNTGKTSVLEAIQFLCAPNKFNLMQIARQREKYRARMGIDFLDSIKYLFDITQSSSGNYELLIGGKIHEQAGSVSVRGEVETHLVDLQELEHKQGIIKHSLGDETEKVETFYGKIRNDFDAYGQLELFESNTEEFEINKYTMMRWNPKDENTILKNRSILTVDHVLENAFSDLISNSKIKSNAVKLLQEEFDENIADLRIIGGSNGMRYTPVVENSDGDYIPLSLYGDGMKKSLTMLNAIVNTQNGVVLIDEFETALHTSAMKKVFSFLIESARKSNVQLFLTTHSLEALDKMLECTGDSAKKIRVIRLKKKNGKTFSRVMNGEEALENRKDYDMELRL